MVHFIVHPVNPQRNLLEKVVTILKNQSGICVYPTDTVYGMGACVSNAKAIDRIGRILEKDKNRLFSFVFSDFAQVSTYAHVSNSAFKIMKHHLPGPFTFILPATHYVPKKVCPKRKTIGVRIPQSAVCRDLVTLLGEPLANTSVNIPGADRGDPELVRSAVLHDVDAMLDIGILDDARGSTIIDLTDSSPVIIREGKGIFEG